MLVANYSDTNLDIFPNFIEIKQKKKSRHQLQERFLATNIIP